MRKIALFAFLISPVSLLSRSYTLTLDDLVAQPGYGPERDIIETLDHKYTVSSLRSVWGCKPGSNAIAASAGFVGCPAI